MNEIKKIVYVQGRLLAPLMIDHCAIIAQGAQVIRTSRIVAIREVSGRRVSFETRNSYYFVELAPVPVSATIPAYSQCAAA